MQLKKMLIVAAFAAAVVCCVSNAALAGVIAYWPLNGTVGDNVGSDEGKTFAYNGTPVTDESGNGNTLSAWSLGGGCGFAYTASHQANVPAGMTVTSSVHETSWWPSLETWSAGSHPTGTDIQTITPTAWTVEASIQMDNLNGNQTVVGRDTTSGAAKLYLSTRGDHLWVEFTDIAGNNYQLGDSVSALTVGDWYNLAAVSDGSTLSLYKEKDGETSYALVGSMPLTGTNSGLAKEADDQSWSVGRGRWGGGDVDRLQGNINQVRISDTALSPDQLLFAVPEPATFVLLALAGVVGLFYARFGRK